MSMRLAALSALFVAAAVGCGVPPPPTEVAQVPMPLPKDKPPETPKPTDPKVPDPKVPTPKSPDENPAKLGLQITDTKVGTGDPAEDGDTCYMLYRGTLKSNGTEFDSSEKNGGKPFGFQLGAGQVIKGWDLGVKGMKPGGKRTLVIPAALAYGAQDKGASIPANSDLVFDITLLDVLKAKDASTVIRQIVKAGSGPTIKEGDVVSIQYVGKFIDGKEFDSTKSSNGGKPIQFKVGSPTVKIPGLNAAVVGLKSGAVANVTIPPSLGFGPMDQGAVPPNSILKFEITVVSVN